MLRFSLPCWLEYSVTLTMRGVIPAPEPIGVKEIAKPLKIPPNPLFRHPERSEGPLFEGSLDDQQRSFALLRMTRLGVLSVESAFQFP